MLFAVLIASALGLCSELWWAEYFAHFQFHYWLGLMLLSLFYALTRQYRLMVFALTGCAANLIILIPFLIPEAVTEMPQDRNAIRIASININSQNNKLDAMQDTLLKLDADVILLIEITSAQAGKIETLHQHYSHRLLDARDNSFGIAILSRLPFDSVSATTTIDDFSSVIEARLVKNHAPITILGVHFYAPVNREWMLKRNRQLHWLKTRLQQNGNEPALVIGDFNVSSYTHAFRDFVAQTNMLDSSKVFGRYSSWPDFLGPLGIPIDHALVSRRLNITQRRITTVTGTDHKAVTVDIVAR